VEGNPRAVSGIRKPTYAHAFTLLTKPALPKFLKRGQVRRYQVAFEEFQVYVTKSVDEEMKFERVRTEPDGPP